MDSLHLSRSAWSAKLFAFGSLGLFVITVVTMLASFSGSPAVDLARHDYGIFSVGFFCALDPFVFLLIAGLYLLYSKIGSRPLNPPFVWLHFSVSAVCACVAVYLCSCRIDLPVPDWQQIMGRELSFQIGLFLTSRFIFVFAQIFFIIGLLLNLFLRRPRRMER